MKTFSKFLSEQSITIGKTYTITSIQKGREVEMDVEVTDYVKKPGAKSLVKYKHKGKTFSMPAGTFKGRII